MTGTRWFWTNSLGTIYVSTADDFDAEDSATRRRRPARRCSSAVTAARCAASLR